MVYCLSITLLLWCGMNGCGGDVYKCVKLMKIQFRCKIYAILQIFQRRPADLVGLFIRLILASGPYVWHPVLDCLAIAKRCFLYPVTTMIHLFRPLISVCISSIPAVMLDETVVQ